MMEFLDLYDEQRRPLHRTHRRGEPMRKGEYHVVAFVWIFSGDGRTLLLRRSPEKRSYPNFWAATGGAVQAGETSLQAISRELREETGICAAEEEFHLLSSTCVPRRCYFEDIFALQKDVPLTQIVFQPGETCGAKWVNREEMETMISCGELAPPDVEWYRRLSEPFKTYLW